MVLRTSWLIFPTSLALLLLLDCRLHARPDQPGGSPATVDVFSCEVRRTLRTVDAISGIGAALMTNPGTTPGSMSVYPGSMILWPFYPDCDGSLASNTAVTSEPPLTGGYLGTEGRYSNSTSAGPGSGKLPAARSAGNGTSSPSAGGSPFGISSASDGNGLLGGFTGAGGSTGSSYSLVGGGISGVGIAGSSITGSSGYGDIGSLSGGGFGGGSGFGGGIAGAGGTSGSLGGPSGGGSRKGPPLYNPEPSSIILLLVGTGGLLCYAGWKRRRSAS